MNNYRCTKCGAEYETIPREGCSIPGCGNRNYALFEFIGKTEPRPAPMPPSPPTPTPPSPPTPPPQPQPPADVIARAKKLYRQGTRESLGEALELLRSASGEAAAGLADQYTYRLAKLSAAKKRDLISQQEARTLFASIPGYRDAKRLAKQCEVRIRRLQGGKRRKPVLLFVLLGCVLLAAVAAGVVFILQRTHVHNYVRQVTVAAGCTTNGLATYTCSRCGDSYTQIISKTGHDYVKAITTQAACEEEGEATYTCSRCGDSYTETIEKKEHVFSPATYDAPKTCKNCGYTEGNVLGYLAGEDILCEHKKDDYRLRVGDVLNSDSNATIGYYKTDTLNKCRMLHFNVKVYNYDSEEPYPEVWVMYIQDETGKWSAYCEFKPPENTEKTFKFTPENQRTICALLVLPKGYTNFPNFTYTVNILDAQVTVN